MKLHLHALVALVVAPIMALTPAAGQTFSNLHQIAVPSLSVGSPYPSTINVSGVYDVRDVRVTLFDLWSTNPIGFSVLLVGPQGQTVMLMNESGSFSFVSNVTLTFADGAPPLPSSFSQESVLRTATYAPTDHNPLNMPSPAPPGPYGSTMSGLLGADVNGTWSLYVRSRFAGSIGSLAGWSISFSTRQPLTYQGELTDAGAPMNGSADLEFSLWTAPNGGSQVGSTILRPATPVVNGRFTAELAFGVDLAPGTPHWLEISVNGTTLSPRQRLTPAPQAETAATVPWTGIVGIPPDLADGVDDNSEPHWRSWAPETIGYLGRVGIGTNEPTDWLCVDPQGPGGIIIGSPQRSTGGRTSLTLNVTASESGDAVIESISRAGQAYGRLLLNPVQGFVGINTPTPNANLTVNGTATKPGGGSWGTFSDARLKHDVTPLEGSLDQLLSLRGVSFVYNDPGAVGELPGRRIGMIAQEVERVFPDWVDTGANGYKVVTFRGFEALAVEAMRELREENERLSRELAARADALQAENAALRRELEALKTAIKRIAGE